jgi:hypothetical protein
MIKLWQAQGIHLWTKKEATLFLALNVHTYYLGGSLAGHATASYQETTLTADYATGVSLTVASTSGMLVGDFLGVQLDNGVLKWAIIATVPNSTTVTTTVAINVAASADNLVFFYTTKITRPLFIFSSRRHEPEDRDIPLIQISHDEYFSLPNKTSTGFPTQFNYDPQLDSGIYRIWPTPTDVKNRINFTYAKSIEDFDSSIDNPDFPQEWLDPLVLNLSVRLAPDYGKASGENYQSLKEQAAEALALALRFDSEIGNMIFQPDYEEG